VGAAGWTYTIFQLALRGFPQAFLFKAHILTYYSRNFVDCKGLKQILTGTEAGSVPEK